MAHLQDQIHIIAVFKVIVQLQQRNTNGGVVNTCLTKMQSSNNIFDILTPVIQYYYVYHYKLFHKIILEC